MDRQPPAVHIIRLFTQEVEQLGVAHGNQEVKGIVRVAHNEKQGSFPVSQGIQFQLIIGRDLPQLRNIKYSKARAAGNQDRFCGLARRQLVLFILADGKVAGIPGFQLIEHQIHGILKFLIVLPDLHRIDKLNEGGEVLFLNGSLIVDVPDERAVQKRFRLDPKIIPGLALAFGIGNESRDQLQDVLL